MTLFGNILQNPQDPRARSDVRLMNLVVSFLTMLGSEEENGGVKRMLGVCSEFERIAKVVLDKSEKDSSSRRKRKSHDDPPPVKLGQTPKQAIPSPQMPIKPPPPQTPMGFQQGSPNLPNPQLNGQAGFGRLSASPAPGVWMPDNNYNDGNDYIAAGAGVSPYGDMQGYLAGNVNSPLNTNTFQQPFVPPDLWQMPMTLEWDWADMTGGTYPSFENGMVPGPAGMVMNQNMQNAAYHQ